MTDALAPDQAEFADLIRQRRAAVRLLKSREARDSLIAYTKFTMPDVKDPEDAEKSRYQDEYFHRALAAALEGVECGDIPRLIITFPPRHGKSELTSRRFPAWLLGRDPYRHIMFGTYNQPFAEDFGRKVREIIKSPAHQTVFPDCALATGSQASDRLATEDGGMAVFVGRGGSATGRGADFLIIDDPLKDRAEAESDLVRKALWDWFNDTMSTRLMSDTGAIIIIMTRWHEDDLVGRLTDPNNPCYNEDEAKNWKIINIPAIAGENDALGRKPGEALWPQRFGIDYLRSFQARNPRGFSALYQQEPTPRDGVHFKEDMFRFYRRDELPNGLRIYAASDHAVSTKQENDKTCLLIAGVDERSNIWLLDAWWKRARTDATVEAMLALMRKWRPIAWWAESGHITKSIGPFLFKRMAEEKVFAYVKEQSASKDKLTRAQPIIGRMGMGMVMFPSHEPWTEAAKQELMKFPGGRHDDFVDALAHMGQGLEDMLKGVKPQEEVAYGPRVGSMAWVKHDATYRGQQAKIASMLRGM